jgi:transaldolase
MILEVDMANTYLEWINESTPTRWWHDSGNPEEIELARKRGALGVTTNPVLTYRTFQTNPEFWQEKVDQISPDLDFEERAEALLRLVATYAADYYRDVYEATDGEHGLALGQLNPARAGDYDGMLAQARRVHEWAPNIAVKLPATKAGIEVIEQIASEGIPICATINVSVAQAIAVAKAYEKGKKKAIDNGIKPGLCLVVQQVGRLDDYIRDVAKDMRAEVSESDIIQAGLAVAKRTYSIFEKEGYSSIIMPAGLRGVYHLTEMSGAKVTFTINTRVQDMILEANPVREERINIPINPEVIKRLMTIPEFVRAYEPDGLNVNEFITYGVTQKLLSQFNETGWAPLEVYGSAKKSSRWI